MSLKRKQAFSVRLAPDDIQAIEQIASRLGATESDVIRFSVKSMLALLSPLKANNTVGRDVLPVFLELGGELCRHFELDERRLDVIVNGKADRRRGGHPIEADDIRLLLLMSSRQSDSRLRMFSNRLAPDVRAAIDDRPNARLNEYLYGKYFADNKVKHSPRAAIQS